MKVSALLAGGTGGDLNFLAPIPCITGSPPFFLSSSPVGYFWEILVGMCRPVLKILTLFLTKKFHYPHFQTWPPKARPVFRPKIT